MIENNTIKISVALCTFNGEDYLIKQLDSIINQSKPVNEIIICDDCSTDTTIDILESYKNKYPNTISYYLNDSKLYTVKNFERAISLTTGDYIFISDQDDVWEPEKVKLSIDYFKQNEDCLMIFTNASLIDSEERSIKGDLWSKWGFDKETQNQWLNPEFQIKSLIQNINKATGATVAFKKNLKKDIIPINIPKGVWHDCFFAIQAAKNKGLHFINKKLIKYRVHNNQQVGIGNGNSMQAITKCSFGDYRKYLEKDFKEYLKYYDAKYSNQIKEDVNKKNVISKIISFFKFINK